MAILDLDSFHEIWQTITRNKTRSLLTAFGVFWGILMLVIMAGLGRGLAAGIMGGLESFPSNSAFFFPNRTTIPYKGFAKGRWWQMDNSDIEAVRSIVPSTRYIGGAVFGPWATDNNVVRGSRSGSFRVMGLPPDYQYINPTKIIAGRFINDIDIREARNVCVIGLKILNDMYRPGEDAVGSTIRVNGVYYTVVGVVQTGSDKINIFGSMDEMVCLPVTTMQRADDRGDKIDVLMLTIDGKTDINPVMADVSKFIKRRHMVSPDDEIAMDTFNLKQIFDVFSMLELAINVLIWIVGIGTLLAGVVGVSNIMIVTVRERTQEIGVRRALGATPSAIIRQIMAESFVLTVISGLAGLIAGVGILVAVSQYIKLNPSDFFAPPQISFGAAVAALIVLVIFGLFAGFLPSKRALEIKAIDALRDE